MALINHAKKEVVFKVVYCGPGLGGKTTNLEYIHSRIKGEQRGDLVSLSTSTDRTMFFDFLPVNAPLANGYQSKFQLYTVPGQVMYNATRQLVLKGVDGLVFVADSMPDRLEENVRAFRTMEENVERNQGSLASIPLVLQYNKRDLPGAVAVERLEASLNAGSRRLPAYEAVASEGYQVFAVLNAVSQMILQRFYKVTGMAAAGAPAGEGQGATGVRAAAAGSTSSSVAAAKGLAR
ncbi:MAG: ADP-ribosylation factor-like protein [Verrucomicrobiota bacterium]